MQPREVALFGGFALRRGTEMVPPIASRVGRSLFAYLAEHQGVALPREWFVHAFWPELSGARGRRRPSHTLWQLQDALSELPGGRELPRCRHGHPGLRHLRAGRRGRAGVRAGPRRAAAPADGWTGTTSPGCAPSRNGWPSVTSKRWRPWTTEPEPYPQRIPSIGRDQERSAALEVVDAALAGRGGAARPGDQPGRARSSPGRAPSPWGRGCATDARRGGAGPACGDRHRPPADRGRRRARRRSRLPGGPLDVFSIGELTRVVARGQRIDPAAAARLGQETGGNPLFVAANSSWRAPHS